MSAHLSVIHHTALALVDKFNRIFNSDNVIFSGLVRLVDNGRQCRGFATPCGACDQYQASGECGQLGYDRRQAQVLNCEDVAGNFSKDRPDTVSLHKIICPIARKAGNFITKIHIPCLFKYLDLMFRRNFIKHGPEVIIVQDLVFDSLYITRNPEHGWLT